MITNEGILWASQSENTYLYMGLEDELPFAGKVCSMVNWIPYANEGTSVPILHSKDGTTRSQEP